MSPVGQRTRPPQPDGIRVDSGVLPEDSGGYRTATPRAPLIIVRERRGFRARSLDMLLATVAWIAVCAVFAHRFGDGASVAAIVVPLAVPAFAATFLTYMQLVRFINATTVRIDSGLLHVNHGPLPWFGNRATIPTASLRQVFVRRTFAKRIPRRQEWGVFARTRGAAITEVVTGLDDLLEAEFLEWAIETYLGVEDDPSANDDALG